MKQKSGPGKAPAEQVLKDIRRRTRRHYSAEEKIRIVLEGLRGEESISELCHHEGIAASIYYGWSKEFLEAGKRRLAGDTARVTKIRFFKQQKVSYSSSIPWKMVRRIHDPDLVPPRDFRCLDCLRRIIECCCARQRKPA